MRAIVRCNNKKQASIDFPIVPQKGLKIRLKSGELFKIKDIIFVQSNDITEVDHISHYELECEKL